MLKAANDCFPPVPAIPLTPTCRHSELSATITPLVKKHEVVLRTREAE
jgi:hypothetical protein